MNYSFSFLNNFFQRNLTKQKTDHATSNSRNSYEKKGTECSWNSGKCLNTLKIG